MTEEIVDPCLIATTGHTQVRYVTKNGVETQVDIGLSWTLEILKLLGVETYYSCEGDRDDRANLSNRPYVLGSGRDFLRLEREIKRLVRQGKLSRESTLFAKYLFGDCHSLELSHFKDEGTDLRFQFHIGEVSYNNGSKARVTKTYSNFYGFRTHWRWRWKKQAQLDRLLSEVIRLRA